MLLKAHTILKCLLAASLLARCSSPVLADIEPKYCWCTSTSIVDLPAEIHRSFNELSTLISPPPPQVVVHAQQICSFPWHRCNDHKRHESLCCLGLCRQYGGVQAQQSWLGISRHKPSCRCDHRGNSTVSQRSRVCVVILIKPDLKHRRHSLQQLRYFSLLFLSQRRQGLQTRLLACHRQCSISSPVSMQLLQVIASNAHKVTAVDDFNRRVISQLDSQERCAMCVFRLRKRITVTNR